MPFMMNCNNRGCGKNQVPTLDLKDNEVYCSECGKVIASVSQFTKTQMKSLGQTRKPPRPAYSVRCDKCKQEALPKIDASDKLVCSWCGNLHKNISAPFALLIRNAIAKGEQDL
jgi:ribosomal protein L34E